jgi:uncharacterized glyoxalase superfamily protein PhnB
MTETTLHSYFGYRDAPAAIDWLERTFGFETTMRFPDEQGGVMHAELRLGDAAILVFSDRDGYERPPRRGETTGSGAYLCVADAADVDTVHARAREAGATVVWEPATNQWGSYRCRVVDPEGFEWTFGTYRPGEPATWGED